MFRLRRLGATPGLLAIAVVVAAISIAAPSVTFVATYEAWLADLRIARMTPVQSQREDIVAIGIDEATLAGMPYRSPVDRGRLADWIAALDAAGAAAIALDIVFDQPTEPAKDSRLQTVIAATRAPVIVGWAGAEHGLTEPQLAFQQAYLGDAHKGYVGLGKNAMGTVRWIPAPTPDGTALAFVPAIMDALGGTAPTDRFEIVYRGPTPERKAKFKTYTAKAVERFPAAWIGGRIVLIGAVLPPSSPQNDRHRTPFAAGSGGQASEPGVIIHAHALAQLLDGVTAVRPDLATRIGLAIIVVAIGVLLAAWSAQFAVRLTVAGIATAALWVVGFYWYQLGGPLIPLATPTVALAAAFGLASVYVGGRLRAEKRMIRNAFAHYVAPSIVSQLERQPERLRLGGEWREVTYLFTDIAGFTTLSESMDPAALVQVLNAYLDVLEHSGTIDKFIGDAVVAVFGAPDDQPDHAARAVRCAQDLDRFAQTYSEARQAEGVGFGMTRIGVHTGPAIVGNFGGEERFDYTAIGDTVNAAARLEGANKYLGTRVCVSGTTAAQCDGLPLRPIGELVVKGKTEGVMVFELVGQELIVNGALADYVKAYETMRSRDPSARAAFDGLVRSHPDDSLAAYHLARLTAGEVGARIELKDK